MSMRNLGLEFLEVQVTRSVCGCVGVRVCVSVRFKDREREAKRERCRERIRERARENQRMSKRNLCLEFL